MSWGRVGVGVFIGSEIVLNLCENRVFLAYAIIAQALRKKQDEKAPKKK
jgi:hypothetical protein